MMVDSIPRSVQSTGTTCKQETINLSFLTCSDPRDQGDTMWMKYNQYSTLHPWIEPGNIACKMNTVVEI